MFLSKKHLILHNATGDDKLALKGILIDPKAGTATASDGKRLVEISLPKVEKFPVEGLSLMNERALPFLLPAEAAREIIQDIPEGKNASDPSRYAAVTCTKDGKISLITTKQGKTSNHRIAPIDAVFPDYRKADVFPKSKPLGSIVMDGSLLRSTLGAVAIDEYNVVTLHFFKDRIVLGATGKDGMRARAVQMPLGQPAPEEYDSQTASVAPKPEKAVPASSPAAAKPPGAPPKEGATSSPGHQPQVEETLAAPASGSSSDRHYYGNRRFLGKKRAFDASTVNPETPASTGQRAFLTYLIRSRGQTLKAADCGALSMKSAIERIEALKKAKTEDESFATFPQWRKLFTLLVEDHKVGLDMASAVLRDLTSITATSEVIDGWVKKAPAQAVA